MTDQLLKVNYEKYDEDIYIDNDDIYVNHTGDSVSSSLNFIHNTCELLFVEDGCAEYFVNGHRYVIQKNSVLIIGATQPHAANILRTPYIRYGLYYMPSFLATLPMIREYLDVYATTTPEQAGLLCDLPRQVFTHLCRLVEEIYFEVQISREDSREMINALTWQLALSLSRLLQLKKNEECHGDNYTAMLKIRTYIERHFAEDLSLARLSALFYSQPATICRSFNKCFGTTVGNYITLIRISNAVKMLEHSSMSITDIAHSVGYNNVNTFIRAFNRAMQVSPLQYRKRQVDYMKSRAHYTIQPN